MINKQAVSNRYLSKIISSQSSSERLAQFSNRQVSGANRLVNKIRSAQQSGDVKHLQGNVAVQNNRLSAARMSAQRSLNLSVNEK